MTYNPNLIIPPEVMQACQTLQVFAAKHDPSGTGQWQIGGLGPVFGLQRQLDLAKTALGSIARSYPETEEGQALAETAREALKEISQ